MQVFTSANQESHATQANTAALMSHGAEYGLQKME